MFPFLSTVLKSFSPLEHKASVCSASGAGAWSPRSFAAQKVATILQSREQPRFPKGLAGSAEAHVAEPKSCPSHCSYSSFMPLLLHAAQSEKSTLHASLHLSAPVAPVIKSPHAIDSRPRAPSHSSPGSSTPLPHAGVADSLHPKAAIAHNPRNTSNFFIISSRFSISNGVFTHRNRCLAIVFLRVKLNATI